MQINLIQSINSSRLILIFAGWAMDHNPLATLQHPDYDIAVAFDYRHIPLETPQLLQHYDEICIFAWSFGVPAANIFIKEHPELPITSRIAINGTLHPVDNLLGIPKSIFEGTFNNLSATSLTKFRRRMCGSSAIFSTFINSAPQRTDIQQLADELRAISSLSPADPADAFLWDAIYISDSDRIIPTENQIRAWQLHPGTHISAGPHLPNFQSIIDQTLISKPLVGQRFAESSSTYGSEAHAQAEIADCLMQKIAQARALKPTTGNILEIGCGTGLLSTQLAAGFPSADLTLWDLTPIASTLPGTHKQCDAETEIRRVRPNSLTLIASASTIQWFNSPATFIRNCAKALQSGGLLALSTFGPDNYAQLRPYLSSAPHYIDIATWQTLLSRAGLRAITVCDDRITKTFPNTAAMLRHIRHTGVNALRPSPNTNKQTRSLLNSGLTSLTYNPLYIIAEKK